MPELDDLKKTLSDMGRAWEEHKATMQTRDAEVAKYGKALGETEQKLAKISSALDNLEDMKTRLENAEKAIARKGGIDSPQENEAKAALDLYARKADASKLTALIDKKAMSVNSDPGGGYFVTADMSGRIIRKVFETSPIRQVASVQQISTDALEGFVDRDNAGFAWSEVETAVVANTSAPKVGKWRITVHEWQARPKATQKLLEDAAVDIEGWLVKNISETVARGVNTAFVSGSGVGQPRGFLTYANGVEWKQIQQVVSGAASALTADGLLDLVYSLKSEYRNRAQFAMQRLTLAAVRKLKDGEDQYLWAPGLQAGQPSTLLGFAVQEFADMPSVGAGALAVAFADWSSAYQIVDRVNLSILRDPYTSKPEVEFFVRGRVGGDVLDFDAIKLQKVAAS